MSDTTDIVARLSGMAADHGPDGWPAVQMRDITALCDEVTRLREALAQAGAAPELWQYRWTNPAGDVNREDRMAWKPVVVLDCRMQTIQQRIDEIRAYRYDGKPVYEVRALYAHPAPTQREPLSDAQIAEIVLRTVYEGDASTPYRDAWAAEIGAPFARAIERAHGIGTTRGTKGAARTKDTAPGDLDNDGAKRPSDAAS